MTGPWFATLQEALRARGFYSGQIDGVWGPVSETALVVALAALPVVVQPEPEPPPGKLAWGRRVSQIFRDRVRWIADELGFDPSWLMAAIAWESGRSFRSDIRNMAGSGATGLIQFMPATARALGTTTEAMAQQSPEDQLKWVYRYFEPYAGKIKNLADLYMAILWPRAVGQPDDYALFSSGITYTQNAGLDTDRDHRVTKREAAGKVYGLLAEGMKPENVEP